MSLWHSPQTFESMKKLDGMMSLVFVLAEDGKNGDFGPPPSSSMEVGTISGFLIRCVGFGLALRQPAATAGSRISSATAAAKPVRKRRQPSPSFALRQTHGASAATPSPAVTTCAQKAQRF